VPEIEKEVMMVAGCRISVNGGGSALRIEVSV
jgi:hypothetical protein